MVNSREANKWQSWYVCGLSDGASKRSGTEQVGGCSEFMRTDSEEFLPCRGGSEIVKRLFIDLIEPFQEGKTSVLYVTLF